MVLRPGELERVRRAALASGRPWEARYALIQTFSRTPTSHIYYIYRRREAEVPYLTRSEVIHANL